MNQDVPVNYYAPNAENEQVKLLIQIKNILETIIITCCAKLLKFDWLKAVQLIRNCTAENNTECVQVVMENDWFSWCAKFAIARDLVHLINSSK